MAGEGTERITGGRANLRPPWKPGESGNPGGRPKKLTELRNAAMGLSPRALERLGELLESKDERIALDAAKIVLDRAGLVPPKVAADMGEKESTPTETVRATLKELLDAARAEGSA